jgi:hypothetical protein
VLARNDHPRGRKEDEHENATPHTPSARVDDRGARRRGRAALAHGCPAPSYMDGPSVRVSPNDRVKIRWSAMTRRSAN